MIDINLFIATILFKFFVIFEIILGSMFSMMMCRLYSIEKKNILILDL